MLKYLIPSIRFADLPAMFAVATVGALVAGTYGAVHDQIIYATGPEYFTRMKFYQFHYANFGWGNRVFASTGRSMGDPSSQECSDVGPLPVTLKMST